MAAIHFKYLISLGDEQVFESTAEVKLTQKQLKDTEAFVREHDFSPEFQDIPGAIYDKCVDAAFGAALKAYPKFADIEEGLELNLELYMPVSLIMLFSDEVRRKMLTDDPYYMDEKEVLI